MVQQIHFCSSEYEVLMESSQTVIAVIALLKEDEREAEVTLGKPIASIFHVDTAL
jgi:hypothetical protein